MTCADVQRWLDEGRPERPRMREHVAACLHCDREHRAALELDRLLSIAVSANAGFHDAVMRKLQPPPVVPVWIQVVSEPIVPVSIAVAAVIGVVHPEVASALAGLQMTTGIAAFLAPLTLWASWQLFHLYRRLCGPNV